MFNKIIRMENGWRNYLIKLDFSVSDSNSLYAFYDLNKNIGDDQWKYINNINGMFLQLRYGKNDANDNEMLMATVKKEIAQFKKRKV